MAEAIHPFYEAHREAMEASMRQRLDLAEGMLGEHVHPSDIDGIKRAVMDEFGIVLTQMPYVGGADSRMSDFFMRLLGFMAISRVLRRHGVPLSVIGDVEREAYKAQLLTVPEVERLAAGRQFLSPENQAFLREQAEKSRQEQFPEDFVYDFVEPGPGDHFAFGINYKACGFCKFAARHGDKDILPNICGLDFDAYATRGVHLERTQTLAGGATHCDFRFSRLPPGGGNGP
ncbi:L-2-amino-thiazoline-4-carboxylic acid hydrolase [Azospirillum brasilense]|uniref:L-2-amino-thiazoline-4-carboxylic acid hydrolase n=1 Tax=Azospirillum brasilense TaxID=192 RepID=UPI0013B3C7CF|nr:L-2-amino-thiazoline-4-carboxylic acid hydrolase [Azospirillum brasilense]